MSEIPEYYIIKEAKAMDQVRCFIYAMVLCALLSLIYGSVQKIINHNSQIENRLSLSTATGPSHLSSSSEDGRRMMAEYGMDPPSSSLFTRGEKITIITLVAISIVVIIVNVYLPTRKRREI